MRISRIASLRHVALGALAAACLGGPARAAQPPDVYLLLVDTLRGDHLSMYGYERSTTPALAALAKSSTVFSNVTAPSCWTLPSVGSLLTGVYPTVHGLIAHGKEAPEQVRSLRPGVPTIAEAYHGAGYYTAAVIANIWLRKENQTGADRGFDRYEVIGNATATQVHELAEKILQEVTDKPVFLYLHYMEPHGPYHAPEVPMETLGPIKRGEQPLPQGQVAPARHMVKKDSWGDTEGLTLGYYIHAYDRTLYGWDQAFGSFVAWLKEHGKFDRSWISVVADHGEELFERNGWGHGTSLFQEQLVIPWILRTPAGQGKRVTDAVSLLDVAPTLLAATGVRVPPSMHGVDARNGVPKRKMFSEVDACRGDYHSCLQRVVIDGSRKLLVADKSVKTYDLDKDPTEHAPQPGDPVLIKALNDWEAEQLAAAKQFGESKSEELPAAVRERLRALGY